jgi:ribosomal protein S18 acetylase RimI-like enzyme
VNKEMAVVMNSSAIRVRKLDASDKQWVTSLLEKDWGSTMMVSRGRIHRIDSQPGFIATLDNKRNGLVTYEIIGTNCEITLLQSVKQGIGIGTRLVSAVRNLAKDAGCSRLWLITTNDNLHAMGFYQKTGFTLAAVYPNALEESRKFKQISRIGMNGIPLRDEIELEMWLNNDS